MRHFFYVFIFLMSTVSIAHAKNAKFRYLRTISVSELNNILDAERNTFINTAKVDTHYELPPISKATNDVEVYLVEYDSNIPELKNKKVRATGLIVLPVLENRKNIPLISYQHGTVFGKYEVPSFCFQKSNPSGYAHYDGSYETRYMVGIFAGNGFALMAADYFGMGGSAHLPEAYFLKESAQQANYDLYQDVQMFLKSKNIVQSHFFLGGWSLGGLNTTGFLEKLEIQGEKVNGAFTASSPSDPFAALNGLMYHPRQGVDAVWTNSIIALTAFSLENYFSKKGLAKSILNPLYYNDLKSIYYRTYGEPKNLESLFVKLADIPLQEFLKKEYHNPSFFSSSAYGKFLMDAETYRQQFKAPLMTFYGTVDEVIMEPIGQLPETYQAILIGNPNSQSKNKVESVRINGGNHRLTFISASPRAKAWMDTLVLGSR